MKTEIRHNFTDLVLDDENEGRQEFFQMIMETLEDSTFATFRIGVKMPEGAGGYFTNVKYIDSINLPDTVTITNNKVKFDCDKSFAIFIHEASHFLHLTRDGGEFVSPNLRGETATMEELAKNEKLRREVEYEAGWRSLLLNRAYNMFNDRTVLDLNLVNMFNYDMLNHKGEEDYKWFKNEYNKLTEDNDKTEFIQKCVQNVNKFSEWKNPDHKIDFKH